MQNGASGPATSVNVMAASLRCSFENMLRMRKSYQWSKKRATFSFHCASGATSERQLCRDAAAGILQAGRVVRRDSFDVGLIRADANASREMVRLDLH